ncbi:unnamed protein product, partial [Polarella glacialis]
IVQLTVAIYTEVKDFTRKALLAAHPLSGEPPGPSSSSPIVGLECLRRAVEVLRGGHRAGTLLQPSEFLVVLRLEPVLPSFVREVQGLLEQIVGFQDPWCPLEPSAQALPQLAGSFEHQLLEVPLRRSLLSRFPRQSPLDLVLGLENVLREYSELGLEQDAPQLQAVLVSLAFRHLCFFSPKSVSLQDGADGLATRLGVNLDQLAWLKEMLVRPPLNTVQ